MAEEDGVLLDLRGFEFGNWNGNAKQRGV